MNPTGHAHCDPTRSVPESRLLVVSFSFSWLDNSLVSGDYPGGKGARTRCSEYDSALAAASIRANLEIPEAAFSDVTSGVPYVSVPVLIEEHCVELAECSEIYPTLDD